MTSYKITIKDKSFCFAATREAMTKCVYYKPEDLDFETDMIRCCDYIDENRNCNHIYENGWR